MSNENDERCPTTPELRELYLKLKKMPGVGDDVPMPKTEPGTAKTIVLGGFNAAKNVGRNIKGFFKSHAAQELCEQELKARIEKKEEELRKQALEEIAMERAADKIRECKL